MFPIAGIVSCSRALNMLRLRAGAVWGGAEHHAAAVGRRAAAAHAIRRDAGAAADGAAAAAWWGGGRRVHDVRLGIPAAAARLCSM